MTARRSRHRSRPTIRCLVIDLDLDLPGPNVDLREVDHSLLEEVRRLTPKSPQEQKRVLAIDHPLVYRTRVLDKCGVTRVEEKDTWFVSALFSRCAALWSGGIAARQ